MKLKKAFILLPLLSLLSCQTSTTTSYTTQDSISTQSSTITSNSTSSSTTTSSSVEEDIIYDTDPTMASNLLNKYISSSSYSLSQIFNNIEYKTKYTSNSVYDEWSKKGYIQLESFDKETYGESTLFNFTYDSSDNIKLGLPVHNNNDGDVTVFHLASQLNYLLWLTNSSTPVTSANFEQTEDYVLTTDSTILLTLATLVGKADSITDGTIINAKFQCMNNDRLLITLQGMNSNGEYAISTFILKDLNTTTIEKVEDFISTFAFPTTKLSNANLLNLNNDSYTATTEFSSDYGNDNVVKTQRNTIISNNSLLSMESYYYDDKTSDYRLFGKGDDGLVHQYGIDAQNNKIDKKREQAWNTFAVLTSEFSDYSSFLSNDGVHFTYYGALGERLSYSLTYAEISDPEYITLTVENDLVKTIEITYPLSSDENGIDYIETALITLSSTQEISIPEPFVESTDTQTIQNAFNAFKTNDFMYTESRTEESYSTKVFKIDSLLYSETFKTSDGDSSFSNIQTNYGYYNVNSKIEGFSVVNGIPTGNSNETKTSLFDFTNFSFNPLAFEIQDNYIVPKKNLLDVPNYFFANVFNVSSMISSTLKMKLENNKITQITFDVQPYTNIYTVTMDFTYGTFSLPSYLDMTKYVSYSKPSNWFEESKISSSDDTIKEALVEMFGEELASQIPYLYFEVASGHWQKDTSTSIANKSTINLFCSTKEAYNKKDEFFTQYVALLTDYTKGTAVDNNLTDYITYTNPNNNLVIAMREDPNFIDLYFYLAN